jgi:hypothetical protein
MSDEHEITTEHEVITEQATVETIDGEPISVVLARDPKRWPVDLQPTLYRVTVTAILLGLAANTLLWWIVPGDDTFAKIISISSAVALVAILVTSLSSAPWTMRWRAEALLLAFFVWVANIIEFGTQDHIALDSRARQCGLYGAEAVLVLGTYLAVISAERRARYR